MKPPWYNTPMENYSSLGNTSSVDFFGADWCSMKKQTVTFPIPTNRILVIHEKTKSCMFATYVVFDYRFVYKSEYVKSKLNPLTWRGYEALLAMLNGHSVIKGPLWLILMNSWYFHFLGIIVSCNKRVIYISSSGNSVYSFEEWMLWYGIQVWYNWGPLSQEQVSRAGASNYTPKLLQYY